MFGTYCHLCRVPKPAQTFKKLKKDTPLADVMKGSSYAGLVIPAGTRCRMIDVGGTAGKYWIDDLAFFKNTKQPVGLLLHDATHYGIVVDAEEVE
jgi:hypothetical protein